MDILFVTANRIGDTVLSTGLLSHLLAAHPAARVTVACGPLAAPLFAAAPSRVRVIPFAKRPWGGHWLGLWRQVAGRRWDLVVDLRASALAWCLRARERRVLKPAGETRHRLRHLAGVLGLAEPPAPEIWIDEGRRERARALLPDGGPVLALGPTANWGGKQWPAERFVELTARLTAGAGPLPAARVVVAGGPGERAAAEPVLAAVPPERRTDLVGTADLLTVAACLERATLYVGNDSGLMHLAAAVGAPTLGLFGPSREALYAPWGEHTAVVRTARSYPEIVGDPAYDYRRHDSHMGSLSVEAVELAARELLRRVRERAA